MSLAQARSRNIPPGSPGAQAMSPGKRAAKSGGLNVSSTSGVRATFHQKRHAATMVQSHWRGFVSRRWVISEKMRRVREEKRKLHGFSDDEESDHDDRRYYGERSEIFYELSLNKKYDWGVANKLKRMALKPGNAIKEAQLDGHRVAVNKEFLIPSRGVLKLTFCTWYPEKLPGQSKEHITNTAAASTIQRNFRGYILRRDMYRAIQDNPVPALQKFKLTLSATRHRELATKLKARSDEWHDVKYNGDEWHIPAGVWKLPPDGVLEFKLELVPPPNLTGQKGEASKRDAITKTVDPTLIDNEPLFNRLHARRDLSHRDTFNVKSAVEEHSSDEDLTSDQKKHKNHMRQLAEDEAARVASLAAKKTAKLKGKKGSRSKSRTRADNFDDMKKKRESPTPSQLSGGSRRSVTLHDGLTGVGEQPAGKKKMTARQRRDMAEKRAQMADVQYIVSSVIDDVIKTAMAYGKRIKMARKTQKKYASRKVVKEIITATLLKALRMDSHGKLRSHTLCTLPQAGRGLVATSHDVSLFDIAKKSKTGTFAVAPPFAKAELHSVAVDDVAGRVFILQKDGNFFIWDTKLGFKLGPETFVQAIQIFNNNDGSLDFMLPDYSLVTVDNFTNSVIVNTTAIDRFIRIYEPQAGSLIKAFKLEDRLGPHRDVEAKQVFYLPQDELLFVTRIGENQVFVYEVMDGTLVAVLKYHTGNMPTMKFIPEGHVLVTGGTGEGDHSICVWDLSQDMRRQGREDPDLRIRVFKPDKIIKGHVSPVVDICYLPRAEIICSLAADGNVKFWDPIAQNFPLTFPVASQPGSRQRPWKPSDIEHVRVRMRDGSLDWVEMKPEFTKSSPPFYNCLNLDQTAGITGLKPCVFDNCEVLLMTTAETVQMWAVGRVDWGVRVDQYDDPISDRKRSEAERHFMHAFETKFNSVHKSLTEYVKKSEAETDDSQLMDGIFDLIRKAKMERIKYGQPPLVGPLQEAYELILALPQRQRFRYWHNQHVEEGVLSPEEVFNVLERLNDIYAPFHDINIFSPLCDSMGKRMVEQGEDDPVDDMVPIREIQKLIGTDQIQIKDMEAAFDHYATTGKNNRKKPLTRAQFSRMMNELLGVSNERLINLFFRTFDLDNNGKISAEEFCAGLSVLCRGSRKDKLKFAFRVYDADGGGYIDRAELFNFISSFFVSSMNTLASVMDGYRTVLTSSQKAQLTDAEEFERSLQSAKGSLQCRVLTFGDTRQIEAMVNDAFDQADRDQDDRMSFDEFVKWAERNPKVTEWLNFVGKATDPDEFDGKVNEQSKRKKSKGDKAVVPADRRNVLRYKSPLIAAANFVRIMTEMDPLKQLKDQADKAIEIIGNQIEHDIKRTYGLHRFAFECRYKKWLADVETSKSLLQSLRCKLQNNAYAVIHENVKSMMARAISDSKGVLRVPTIDVNASIRQYEQNVVFKVAIDKAQERLERAHFERRAYEGVDEKDRPCVIVIIEDPSHHQVNDNKPLKLHLERELNILRRMYSNNHFVKVYGRLEREVYRRTAEFTDDLDPPPEEEYLYVMERMDGYMSLENVFRSKRFLGSPDGCEVIRFWGRQILEALSLLKSNGVILRYLTPANIFISPDGYNVKIDSLRMMAVIGENGTVTSAADHPVAWDNPENPYAPPEQFTDVQENQTPAYDVWGFGCVLFEMLFGKAPNPFAKALCNALENSKLKPKPKKGAQLPWPGDYFFYNFLEGVDHSPLPRAVGPAGEAVLCSKESLVDLAHGVFSPIAASLVHGSFTAVMPNSVPTPSVKLSEDPSAGSPVPDLIDIIAVCLDVNPEGRPPVEALLSCKFFNMDPAEHLAARRNAAIYMRGIAPRFVLDDLVNTPLSDLNGCVEIQLERAKIEEERGVDEFTVEDEEHFGIDLDTWDQVLSDMDTYVLQRVAKLDTSLDLNASLSCSKDLDSQLKLSRNMADLQVIDQVFANRALDKLVIVAQRISLVPDKFGGSDRPLTQVVSLFRRIFASLRNDNCAFAPYIGQILESVMKLFLGEEWIPGSPDPEALFDPATISCPKPPTATPMTAEEEGVKQIAYQQRIPSHWTPEIHALTSPLIVDIFTEHGSGNVAYPVVREFIRQTSGPSGAEHLAAPREGEQRLYNATSADYRRTHSYLMELIVLGDNLGRISNPANGRMRRSALVRMTGIIRRRDAEKLQLCCDFRASDRVLPLLQDKDPEIRNEALGFYEAISEIFRDGPLEGESAWEISRIFCSPVFLSAIVRRLKTPVEEIRNKSLSVKIIRHVLKRPTEEIVRILVLLELFPTLGSLLQSNVTYGSGHVRADMGAREFFNEIFESADPIIMKYLTLLPGFLGFVSRKGIQLPDPVLPSLKELQTMVLKIENTGFSPKIDEVQKIVRVFKALVLQNEYLVATEGINMGDNEVADYVLGYITKVFNDTWDVASIPITASPPEYAQYKREDALVVPAAVVDIAATIVSNGLSPMLLRSGLLLALFICSNIHIEFELWYLHPLREVQCRIQRLLYDIVWAKMPVVADFIVSKGDLVEKYTDTCLMQYSQMEQQGTKDTLHIHQFTLYPQEVQMRLRTFWNLIRSPYPQHMHELLDADHIGRVLHAGMASTLSFKATKYHCLPRAFVIYNDICPIRSETLFLIDAVQRNKDICRELSVEIVKCVKTMRIIYAEKQRLMTMPDRKLQASVVCFFRLIAELDDPQLNWLILESGVPDELVDLWNSLSPAPNVVGKAPAPPGNDDDVMIFFNAIAHCNLEQAFVHLWTFLYNYEREKQKYHPMVNKRVADLLDVLFFQNSPDSALSYGVVGDSGIQNWGAKSGGVGTTTRSRGPEHKHPTFAQGQQETKHDVRDFVRSKGQTILEGPAVPSTRPSAMSKSLNQSRPKSAAK